MCVDTLSNLYITEEFYKTVRKIDAVTGIVTTFAGIASSSATYTLATNGDNGPATSTAFSTPYGVCAGATQLYVVDTSNQWIRAVSLSTGIITTLAGNCYYY